MSTRDVVGYEEGNKCVMDAMIIGYPRFFIHLRIQKVSPTAYDRKYTYQKPYAVIPDMSPEIQRQR